MLPRHRRQLFRTDYWLRRDAMLWFWNQYTTDPAQRAQITASPLRANLDDLSGQPPALVIVGEADVLRDEGEAYAAKLRASGAPVTAVRYQGIIHDFVMVNAPRDTHSAKAATARGGDYVRAALHDKKSAPRHAVGQLRVINALGTRGNQAASTHPQIVRPAAMTL